MIFSPATRIKSEQGEFTFNSNRMTCVLLSKKRQKAMKNKGQGTAVQDHKAHRWAYHAYPFRYIFMVQQPS